MTEQARHWDGLHGAGDGGAGAEGPSALAEATGRWLRPRHADLGVDFRVADFSRPLDLPSESFDVVYSRLSLHYFTDAVTRAVIGDLARVLVRDGLLVVLCRSVADPLWGKGSRIEAGMYRFNDHVRHFFSAGHLRELLAGRFGPARVTEFEGVAYGYDSAFVEAVARRS